MNRYQEKALDLANIDISEFGEVVSKKTNDRTSRLSINNDSILIYGDRDIYSKDYILKLFIGKIANVELFVENEWVPQEKSEFELKNVKTDGGNTSIFKQSFYGIQTSFNLDNRPEKIKIVIPGNVCDDIIININYDLMSEEEYLEVQNSPQTLRKNMDVTIRTGDNLVNIYWKHAKENIIALVRIDLYVGNTNNPQLMGKYKENDEVFFKSITGLAYGNYCFKLYQFDKDNNEIASTDYISFTLAKPSNGTKNNNGGTGFGGRQGREKNTVIIG